MNTDSIKAFYFLKSIIIYAYSNSKVILYKFLIDNLFLNSLQVCIVYNIKWALTRGYYNYYTLIFFLICQIAGWHPNSDKKKTACLIFF